MTTTKTTILKARSAMLALKKGKKKRAEKAGRPLQHIYFDRAKKTSHQTKMSQFLKSHQHKNDAVSVKIYFKICS